MGPADTLDGERDVRKRHRVVTRADLAADKRAARQVGSVVSRGQAAKQLREQNKNQKKREMSRHNWVGKKIKEAPKARMLHP